MKRYGVQTKGLLSGFPFLSLVDFLLRIFMAGFRNNFQDYRRLSKRLLESQAAVRKGRTWFLKRAYWKDFNYE
jgi:hypothetical protein